MTPFYEEANDFDALRKFRELSTDTERMEQMFMTALHAARVSRESARMIANLDTKVGIQNGRIGKLETRWIQGAAVIAFLLVVIPILLATVSLIPR